MCECYKIGGRFIAEDPDCPAHGIEAQERAREAQEQQDSLSEELRFLKMEIAAWQERFPQYIYRRQDDCVALKLNA